MEKEKWKLNEIYDRLTSQNSTEFTESIMEDIKDLLTIQRSEFIRMVEGERKYDLVGIKNGQYITIKDAEIGSFNEGLDMIINKLKEGKE